MNIEFNFQINQIKNQSEENRKKHEYEKQKAYNNFLFDMNNMQINHQNNMKLLDQNHKINMNELEINHQRKIIDIYNNNL